MSKSAYDYTIQDRSYAWALHLAGNGIQFRPGEGGLPYWRTGFPHHFVNLDKFPILPNQVQKIGPPFLTIAAIPDLSWQYPWTRNR